MVARRRAQARTTASSTSSATRRDIPAKVSTIEYDPNRSARIALLTYADGEKRYILQPLGVKVGDTIVSGDTVDILPGNALPLKNIPLGTMIHNVELKPGKGGQIARSAGSAVQLVAKEGDYASVKMPSGEIRKINIDCLATIGQVGNVDHENVSIGKAGRSRWLGKRPHVRGVAMNPVDHPLGGGEGKTSGGRHPVSPWGVPTKGYKTRNRKVTDRFIVTRQTEVETAARWPPGSEWAVREKKYVQITEKGPVRRRSASREGGSDEPEQRQEGHQDLVASFDRDAGDGRAHHRGAQRPQVHPGLHHREHGRPQARRVRADAGVQGPHDEERQGGLGGAGREGGCVMAVQAHATAKYIRTSAQKAGLVLDLIRGRDVNAALATLRFARKSVARDIEKVLRSAIANATQKEGFGGDVERLFVDACYANQGPSQKRIRPAPMGRAFRVVKRTAHLTVQVSERPNR